MALKKLKTTGISTQAPDDEDESYDETRLLVLRLLRDTKHL